MDIQLQDKLRKAIRYGRILEFKSLLNQQKETDPINFTDVQGYNLLHEIGYSPASDPVQLEFFRELYECYLNKYQRDLEKTKQVFQKSLQQVCYQDKKTPVHIVAEHDRRLLLKKFLELGISIYTRDSNGNTPLHLSAQNGHYIIITILLDAEQRNITQTYNKDDNILNCKDRTGKNALHLSAKQAQETSCLILIPRYDFIDIQDDEGNTPLHYAILSQNIRITRALLLRGANRLIQNSQNEAAWDIAEYLKNEDFKSILEEKGDCLEEFNPCKVPLKPIKPSKKGLYFLWFSIFFRFFVHMLFIFPFENLKSIIFVIVELTLSITTIFFLLLSECKDPGYIKVPKEVTLLNLLEKYNPEFVCPICVNRRPHRARHCNICNKCVKKFDHHCPFIYNCVGQNNYCSFIGFLILNFMSCLWSLLITILNLADIIHFDEAIVKIKALEYIFVTLNLMIDFVIWLSLLSLLIIHTGNIYFDLTTHERYNKKGKKKETSNKSQNQSLKNRKSILQSQFSDTPSMFLDEASFQSISDEIRLFAQQEKESSQEDFQKIVQQESQEIIRNSFWDTILCRNKSCCNQDHSYTSPKIDESKMQEIISSEFLLEQKKELLKEENKY